MRAALLVAVATLALAASAPAQDPASRAATREAAEIEKRVAAEIAKENIALIEALENDVQDLGKTVFVRARIAKAQRAAVTLGKDWEVRVRKVEHALKLNEFVKVWSAIESHEAAGRLEAALGACDAAVAFFNRSFDQFDPNQDRELMALYADLVKRSDSLVEKVETPEFEAKVEARDMLAEKERDLWKAGPGAALTATAKAFMMEGVRTDQVNATGVVSLLPPAATPWNDLVVDLEVTVISGQLEMYLRYAPRAKAYRIRFSPAEGYELDKSYPMTIRIRGSQVSLKHPDQPLNDDRFHITTSRTGGLGFGLKPGSKAVVTKLTMKVLR